jgi:hypothetical protein
VQACSPPAPGSLITYSFRASDRALASIRAQAGETVLIRKTTNGAEVSGGMCPDGFSVSLALKSGTDAASLAFTEASKSCGRLFQLYLASTQKFRFEVTVVTADASVAPVCTLSLEEE